MNHIITVAMQIPMMTAGNAFLNFTPRSAAMSEPVQAPVPGSGIPTNNNNAQNIPLFPAVAFNFSPPFFPFSKHQVKNL